MEKPFYSNKKVVLWKKPLEKTPNIGKMREFWKSAILQRLTPMQSLESLQNGQFGSKIKMPKTCEKPFHNNIRVGLCKKPLEKKPNIGEIRQSLKSAILQRL